MASGEGLREEKKRRTRRKLLANAVALFKKQGIRSTRTSEIARLSGISAGTLFNYFSTKDALVEAWLRGELDATLGEAAASLGERGLRPMLRQVCRVLATDCLEPRDLRTEAWRSLGRARSADFRLDVGSPLVRVVRAEQERDRVRKDLQPLALSQILVDGLEGGLVAAVEDQKEEANSASHKIARGLEGRVELILDGLRKRNERVSAPASLRAPAAPPATRTQE